MADPLASPDSIAAVATLVDLPELTVLEREIFGADAWGPEQLRPEVVAGRLLVIRSGGRCAGYVSVASAGDIADLLRIAVGSSYRRRGVATRLLAAALSAAADGGADRMLLEVSEANAGARVFYAHHGFVEIARRDRYYRDGSAAMVLERPVPADPGAPGAPGQRARQERMDG